MNYSDGRIINSFVQYILTGKWSYTDAMPPVIPTFLGFSCMLAWLQTSEQLFLARDAVVHNGSLAAGAVFAVTLLLYALFNRLAAIELGRGFFLSVSIVAAALGAGYAFGGSDGIRLLCFCLQTGCCALLVVSWGERLTLYPYRALLPLACVGGIGAAAVLCACAIGPALLASLAAMLLPTCSGLLLYASSRRSANPDEAEDPPVATIARSGRLTLEPIEAGALRAMPWMLAVVLCLCTFATLLFGGMATNPYLANSRTLLSDMLGITTLGLLLIGFAGWGFMRWRSSRAAEASEIVATPDEENRESALLLHLNSSIALILLIGGLLLLSTKPPGTLTTALGMILGAGNCLVVLCWVLFPRAVADAKLPFVPCFALLVFASGTLYAPYLGAWINKSMSIGFDALTGTATALIAFVAVLVILYMSVRVRQMGHDQHDRAAAATVEPLTLEEIRSALQAHQLKAMEPFGLTEREQQIVMMILDGQTMGGIAEDLFITERTVKFHSKNAYEKLGVRNKKELMQMFSDLPHPSTTHPSPFNA